MPVSGRLTWRAWDRSWVVALGTMAVVGLLTVAPAPLIPIAEGYQDLCERFPALAVATNHLEPVPAALVFILAALALANGAALAAVRFVRTLRGNHRLDTCARPLPPRLALAGRRLALEGRLTYLDHPGAAAYCYGFIRPRVAITSGLLGRLDDQELLAVLAHERYHLRRRDPARYLVVDALAAAAFMFPAAAALRYRLETRVEVAADRAALAATSPGALAGALLAALPGPKVVIVGGAGLSATEARIAHLAGHPVLPPIPVRSVAFTIAVLAMVGVAVVDLATSAPLVRMICPICS